MTVLTDLFVSFCEVIGIKRLLILGITVLSLCGCRLMSVRVDREVKTYETDLSSVSAELIQLKGMRNVEFENRLNEEISNELQSEMVAFDSLAQESSENVRMGNKCVFEVSWEEEYNKNDFLSVVEEKYVYTGGAHGNTVRIPRNIDLAGETEVELKDLFTDSGYTTTLNRLINEELTKDSEEYADLWAKPEIKESHQTDFYIEDGYLVIFFQPYDLSYYARGFVEFRLELTELSGYMKEEYRRLAVE